VVTFGDAHWAELIRPQRWAGVRACPPRRQGKARPKRSSEQCIALPACWAPLLPEMYL